IADRVIKLGVSRFGKLPKEIVSDGLSSYITPIKNLSNKVASTTNGKVKIKHIAGRTFQDKINNNMIERFNRTVRRRVRLANKFEEIHTANSFASGYGAFYNLLRANIGIGNKTPANKAKLTQVYSLRKLLRGARK